MSRQSPISANDKVYNQVKSGAVHRSPGIRRKTEENPDLHLGDHLIKTVRPQLGPMPPNEVSRIAQHLREGYGKEE